ncbi:TonB-dependent receptor [Neolewinella persica]|uniref:TonB-dependent receptor n=1 Tax=Neolewinella persica TaxID=70998 RepID=UPI00037F6F90|nr:TonB-dependent receptor [Neolewinella persica]
MRFILIYLLFSSLSWLAAQDTLRIVDEAGAPLPYAVVTLLPDSTYLGRTNDFGHLALPPKLPLNAVIRVDYVGYGASSKSLRQLAREGYVFWMDGGQTVLDMPTVVGRRNEIAAELPYQIETVNQADITRTQSLTTADALANLSGVYVQKSQFGGGSPVVRGFEANRVLLVVDGVRMNNAIFRNGHLQNTITVDPLALDRLELIYGAGALAYGSDALGGVVHFRTQEPMFKVGRQGNQAGTQDAKWEGQGAINYGTAAHSFAQSVRLAYSAENFASLTLLSTTFTSHLRAGAQRSDRFADFGLREEYVERQNGVDVVVPNDAPNQQIGTAYNQYNLLQKFRFRLKDRLELSANFQLSTTSDIPRYDALIERRAGQLRWARWDYGPQTRALAALRLDDRRPTALYDLASYLLSYQFVAEDRIQRLFGDPQAQHDLVDVHATNLQADFTKSLGNTTLRYGFDLRYDAVTSVAYLQNIDDGSRDFSGISTRYPSQGSGLASGGAYAEATYPLSREWKLRGGLRYSRQRLNARFGTDDPIAWPQAYLDGIKNTEGATTAALGLIHKSGPHHWRALFAQGFRAPNIDDFAKFRENNGFIQVPNPELQPERSNTLETGYRFRAINNRLELGLTAYHSWLNQAIIRQNGTLPNGQTSFVSRGETLFAQTNVNAESARIYGLDLDARITIGRGWRLTSAFHYLRGRRDQLAPDGSILDLPQDHIPPPYGQTALGWARERWNLSCRVRYQLAKAPEDYAVGAIFGSADDGFEFDRLGTADNLELTPLKQDITFAGSLAWWTINLYAAYDLNDHWSLRLKGENLLDRHYRTFASGVSSAGIDLGFGVTAKW